MELDEDQIQEIENMAELFFSPEEIAENIEVDTEEFSDLILAKHGEAYKAFRTGWLRGEIPLRKSIAQAATNGSNPAQVRMSDIASDVKGKL